MKINFKQPKYVLPLLALPFLCLFFYVWHSGFSKEKTEVKPQAGLNGNVGSVSADVRKKNLASKLDAYRNTFKEADGYTAVNVIPKEASSNAAFKDRYTGKEKQTLDSISRAMKAKYESQVPVSNHDQALANAISGITRRQKPGYAPVTPVMPTAERDPMAVFRQQMAYMDSVRRERDPAYQAEKRKKQASERLASTQASIVPLAVVKNDVPSEDFNTVKPQAEPDFIKATIDENLTGYAGSRLRLRLLEDIQAGSISIKKDTYIYALISGFSGQRVTLAISSILYEGKILPVKLQVYDLDGLPGLYVPSSAFRDFTKDIVGNSVQGVNIDGGNSGSQFVMSTASRFFQSTSTAVAELIRKNKAKMKYNSYIYLIDPDSLQKAQQGEVVTNSKVQNPAK